MVAKIANVLHAHGVRRGDRVAVYLPMIPELAATMLACARIGAVHSVVFAGFSAEALRGRILDAGAKVVVTANEGLRGGKKIPLKATVDRAVEGLAFVDCVLVARRTEHEVPMQEGRDLWLADEMARQRSTCPAEWMHSESPLFTLYTSGSTGKPKGVVVRHRSLLNHSLAVINRYHLSSRDRALQFAAIGFDVAAEELFPTLLAGARVVLRPDELLSPGDLLRFIERERVTVANLPSSYWHELVNELSRTGMTLPPSLRLIVIGSEKVAPEKLTAWHNLRVDKPQLINAYGLTETTITTSTYFCPNQPTEDTQRSVPVGRPIANAKIYLLDSNLQLAPLGVPGELCVSGDLLARGYLNQPSLTAERFIPDPFSDAPGARLYRTGDLARYLSDGNIELLGRTDHQIKFRGFRIELGEIESVLAQHPDVRDAVVLLVTTKETL
jgi:amino acid adenylation domain-containing protein